MKLSDFSYDLPEDLIAQHPSERRDACRLLCLDKSSGDIRHAMFPDILDYMQKGDCLILNAIIQKKYIRLDAKGTGNAQPLHLSTAET